MPFYNGVANSFADLRTAIFNACVAEGWTLTGDILTKGVAAVRIENNTVSTANKGLGLVIQGGTGISSGALVNASPTTPRMGPPGTGQTQPSWPMEYDIHISGAPDEVFVVSRFNVDFYYWLAFGVSNTPGLDSSGLWLSAICNAANGVVSAFYVDVTGSPQTGNLSTGCIFWDTLQDATSRAFNNQDTIATGLDGAIWGGCPAALIPTSKYGVSAITAATTLLAVQPNLWNSEGILNRIQVLQWRDSDKCSLVADLVNARYVRIDNYAPGQIITLGADRWKIYPFYRKNSAVRNGGTNIDHTGTFGWAIRYDGP